jgi:hypothetical protein
MAELVHRPSPPPPPFYHLCNSRYCESREHCQTGSAVVPEDSQPKKVGHLLAVRGCTHCLYATHNEDRMCGICCNKQISPRFLQVGHILHFLSMSFLCFCNVWRFRFLDFCSECIKVERISSFCDTARNRVQG